MTSQVYWLECGEQTVPEGDQWLGPRELDVLAGLRFAKRRREWRHGRWTAKRAVVALHGVRGIGQRVPLNQIEVLAAPDGAPELFIEGRRGPCAVSLTHREGLAVCALVTPRQTGLDSLSLALAPSDRVAAPRRTPGMPSSRRLASGRNFGAMEGQDQSVGTLAAGRVAIGCDLECVEARSERFVADYFTASERELVAQVGDANRRVVLPVLIWSAKESALKALRTGLRRDTRSVEVTLPGEACGDGWETVRVVDVSAGRAMFGWWRALGGAVLTLVTDLDLESGAAPVALSGSTRDT